MRANFNETMTAGGTTYRRCQNNKRKTTKNLKKGGQGKKGVDFCIAYVLHYKTKGGH